MDSQKRQKIVVVGAGPVGSLAALYAASRGDDVEIYELRGGKRSISFYFRTWFIHQCYCCNFYPWNGVIVSHINICVGHVYLASYHAKPCP